MSWHYAACRCDYRTIWPDGTVTHDSEYSLVEVFPSLKAYTATPVFIVGASKKGLLRQLKLAMKDVRTRKLIVEPKLVIVDMRVKKNPRNKQRTVP